VPLTLHNIVYMFMTFKSWSIWDYNCLLFIVTPNLDSKVFGRYYIWVDVLEIFSTQPWRLHRKTK
jgi:hypothetical protein